MGDSAIQPIAESATNTNVDAIADRTANSIDNSIDDNNMDDSDSTFQEDSPDDEPEPPKYKLEGLRYMHQVENLYDYEPGGFHPVALGDMLAGRFRVAHKLGAGGFATVWLCHDSVTSKWRAVKIMAAHASTPECADLRALEQFKGISADVLATHHIQLPLEHFWLDGPNGRHLCSVLPFLGPRLSEIHSLCGHVPELIKDICFQMIEALRFIHSQGLCHGDFRPDNILFRLAEGVDEWDEDAIIALLGKPVLVRVEHVDPNAKADFEPGVPSYLVRQAWPSYGSGACSSKIAVIDFGVSYPLSNPPIGKGSGIPMDYAAPEELFSLDDDLGFHTDIWALGVTIALMRANFLPFDAGVPMYDDTPEEQFFITVGRLEQIMGPMPSDPYRLRWREWEGRFVNRSVDEDGEPLDEDDWNDETVFATVDVECDEHDRKGRVKWGRAAHLLRHLLQELQIADFDPEAAADIAAQAASHPGRLPTYTKKSTELPYHQRFKYTISKTEIEDLFDLLSRIFKWHPSQRATLDEIANHEWFGDRNRRQKASSSAPLPKADDNLASSSSSSNSKQARFPSPAAADKRARLGHDQEDTGSDTGTETETQDDTVEPQDRATLKDNPKMKNKVAAGFRSIKKNLNFFWPTWSLYRQRIKIGLRKGAAWTTKWLMELVRRLGTLGKTASDVARAWHFGKIFRR